MLRTLSVVAVGSSKQICCLVGYLLQLSQAVPSLPEFRTPPSTAANTVSNLQSYGTPVSPAACASSSSSPSSSSSSANHGDSRTLIFSEGHTFSDQSIYSRSIIDIFQRMFFGPYNSFGKVPLDVRELWLGEFRVRWDPEHDGLICKAWSIRCARLMKASYVM